MKTIVPEIIIFQFGKVGSTSCRNSLNGKYCPEICKYNKKCIQTHNFHVVDDILNKINRKIKIIMMVRFSIRRNISAFFENIERSIGDKTREQILNLSFDELNNKFKNNTNHLDTWMKNASNTLCVDLLKSPFDFEKKHEIINTEKADILLLRYEDIVYWEQIISNFLGTKINMKNDNVGNQKWYKSQYKKFIKNYKLSTHEIEDIKKSQYINKFYTDDEIIKYINEFL
jgi:hypothetical protein